MGELLVLLSELLLVFVPRTCLHNYLQCWELDHVERSVAIVYRRCSKSLIDLELLLSLVLQSSHTSLCDSLHFFHNFNVFQIIICCCSWASSSLCSVGSRMCYTFQVYFNLGPVWTSLLLLLSVLFLNAIISKFMSCHEHCIFVQYLFPATFWIWESWRARPSYSNATVCLVWHGGACDECNCSKKPSLLSDGRVKEPDMDFVTSVKYLSWALCGVFL
jgi:hypothetical protein